ncbi:MAG TPA: ATP-dependent 6-phosphofructokinase [Candidatus Polarisedimenticolaceae bacterium]|nr:ATP-dependent 6-phosphofructokinase [Candidatus Polarisedimenticolaceae bacterium]
MKTAGILTGGGDAPGLNAVMRAVVRSLAPRGWRLLGIRHGWRGLIAAETEPLVPEQTEEWILRGGTVLGTSRTNPYKKEEDILRVRDNFRKLSLDALVALGGEDTLGVAARLSGEGFPVVGVPKTIDNDLSGTDTTFGFDTAVAIATEAVDRLRTTAQSHDRVLVVEVMGRHAGWIALHAGLAGGAHHLLVPERPVDVEAVCATVRRRDAAGRRFSLIVVAEGAEIAGGAVTQNAEKDAFGHVKLGGIGQRVAEEIERRTGHETRSVVLGHVQRGGSPTAHDRVLATRYGLLAADLVHEGRFGSMAALRHGVFQAVSLEEAVAELKTVDPATLRQAEILFD